MINNNKLFISAIIDPQNEYRFRIGVEIAMDGYIENLVSETFIAIPETTQPPYFVEELTDITVYMFTN